MHWFKKLLTTAIWLCIAQSLQAQHHNIWFRGTLSTPISEKLIIDYEFQHRRQNGFDNENMLNRNLLFSFRNWIHYRYNQRITFSLSPFANFSNYPIIQKQSDETASPNSEVRFSGAVTFNDKLAPKLLFIARTALEYRMPHNADYFIRARERLGFGYMFSSRGTLTLFDEVLLNTTGMQMNHLFDHNRAGIDVEYKLSPSIRLNVGYLYITRIVQPSTNISKEHDIFFNFTYKCSTKPDD